MTMRLEHANICVSDVEGMIKFLTTAFPEFAVRGGGKSSKGQWVHVGTAEPYIALSQAKADAKRDWTPYTGHPGVNHLGYEVDDVDSLRERLIAAGYRESTVPNSHHQRKRVYFYDAEGNDWEFVQYFSADPKERNDYDLPDS